MLMISSVIDDNIPCRRSSVVGVFDDPRNRSECRPVVKNLELNIFNM